MLALCFLPHLADLCVSLDIPPAFPMTLNDLPSTLESLRLGAMWLEEMPQQIADCVGECVGEWVGGWVGGGDAAADC